MDDRQTRYMKIRFEIELDVNPEAWAQEFGCEPEPDEIEVDVMSYARSTVLDQLASVGVLSR